jgi:hypothetical protein
MSIVIKTKKVVNNNVGKRRVILDIEALTYDKLPKEYREGDFFYKVGGGVFCSTRTNIYNNFELSEEEFQEYLEFFRKCGNKLMKINKEKKKLAEEWKGEETFII